MTVTTGASGMTQDTSASVPDQALAVPVEPVTRLDPSGFDPSRIEWRTQTSRFAAGKDFILCGIKVGSVFYDGVSNRTVVDRYKIETLLPGMRPKVDRFSTEEGAMRALERITRAWFAKILPAIATEARRAETRTGSVHEGAGPQDIARKERS